MLLACLKGILSTPLPKLLVNTIRVSSLHNLDLDGKFCHGKYPRAEAYTSLLETHIGIICAWSSSLATAPSRAGFCANLKKGANFASQKYQVLCLFCPLTEHFRCKPSPSQESSWILLDHPDGGCSRPVHLCLGLLGYLVGITCILPTWFLSTSFID